MAIAANEKAAPTALNPAHGDTSQTSSSFWSLTFGSIGVVYGDIGTSPLYAFREAVAAAVGAGTLSRSIVLGVLSLIVWALIVVVAVRYCFAASARG